MRVLDRGRHAALVVPSDMLALHWLAVAVLGALVPRATLAVEPAAVTIQRLHGAIRLTTRAAIADVHLRPYRLDLRARASRVLLTGEPVPGGLFYERGTAQHALGAVTDTATLPDGVRLTV